MSELIDRQGVIDRLKKAEDVFRQNGAKLEANGIHYALELVESDIEIPISSGQEKWVDFAKFVATFVVDDFPNDAELFAEDAELFAELACRKLVKLGLVEIDGDVYKLKEAEDGK